ncbi:MAG: ATPase [Rhodospirillaceae bacterium]|nr:ATPase [Rhodospirillaceae bacterium]
MKRFYTEYTIVSSDIGFSIALDKKLVLTPCGNILIIQCIELAEIIAKELMIKGEIIYHESMPFFRLASTVFDCVIPNQTTIIQQLLNYAETDLICYRARTPKNLAERQKQLWQPIVDWLMKILEIDIQITCGVIPIVQSNRTIAILHDAIWRYDFIRLTVLQNIVLATGSLFLGLALIEEYITSEDVFIASQLDEIYQTKLYGEDVEAARSRDVLNKDIQIATLFLKLSCSKII